MPSVPIVVGSIIVDSLAVPTQVLAARRSRPEALRGMWEFPGGKVEPGETPQHALAREVHEELGINLQVGQELAHPDGAWPISDSLELRLFFAEPRAGELKPGDSHDQTRWLSMGELRSMSWLPADEAALDALTARLSPPSGLG